MKKYSLNELQEMAKPHFAKLKVNKLHATEDGQFFLHPNRAQLHAKKNLATYTIDNEDVESAAPAISMAELAEMAGAIEDPESLHQMLLDEMAGANRAEAVEMITDRLDELMATGEQGVGEVEAQLSEMEVGPASAPQAPESTNPEGEVNDTPQEPAAPQSEEEKKADVSQGGGAQTTTPQEPGGKPAAKKTETAKKTATKKTAAKKAEK